MSPGLHPVVEAAGRGELPGWARMSDSRREHAGRVAALLEEWAVALDLPEEDRLRWVAAGWLHDSLKDAPTRKLRKLVDGSRSFPKAVLHGPAAAARLEREGVEDRELLDAVAWHTLGHPRLERLGMAVYCADFLEPGRDLRNEWRARQRERMPRKLTKVSRKIVRIRIRHLLDRKRPVRPETMRFWNRLTEGDAWARASEV